MNNLVNQISEIISNDDSCASWGLRATSENHVVGEELANSFVWVDGEKSEEELNGISTMGINSDSIGDIVKAIKNLGRDACARFGVEHRCFHSYDGQNFVLVKGDSSEGGNDIGESIISNAIVMGIY